MLCYVTFIGMPCLIKFYLYRNHKNKKITFLKSLSKEKEREKRERIKSRECKKEREKKKNFDKFEV